MTKIKMTPFALAIAAALTLSGCATSPTTEASDPEPEVVEAEVEQKETPESEPGTTRENPAPLGTVIADGDWEMVINSVNLDANDLIVDDWNDPPADGNVYIMVNATVTYNGDDPQGEMPWATIDYITAEGNTIDLAYVSYDATDFTLLDPLYTGASHTGDNAYEVPASVDGVLAVSPTMMSDNIFVAIK